MVVGFSQNFDYVCGTQKVWGDKIAGGSAEDVYWEECRRDPHRVSYPIFAIFLLSSFLSHIMEHLTTDR